MFGSRDLSHNTDQHARFNNIDDLLDAALALNCQVETVSYYQNLYGDEVVIVEGSRISRWEHLLRRDLGLPLV